MHRQILGLALIALLAVGACVFIAWTMLGGRDAVVATERARDRRDPEQPHPVELQVPLLADYYNHVIENAPPRNPGFIKRREFGSTIPRRPSVIMGAVSAEPELRQWVTVWEQGQSTTPQRARSLDDLLAKTTLGFFALCELGQAFQYVDGDDLAVRWYRAALDRAKMEFAGLKVDDPVAAAVLSQLQQMGSFWRNNDWVAMEKRFLLATNLQPPVSPECRRAAYLYAEMLHYQNRYPGAMHAMLETQSRHECAQDLTESDRFEMHWVLGLFQYFGGDYAGAIPHLEATAAPGPWNRYHARPCLAIALARVGRHAEATALYTELQKLDPQCNLLPAIWIEIESAVARAKGQRRVGTDGANGASLDSAGIRNAAAHATR